MELANVSFHGAIRSALNCYGPGSLGCQGAVGDRKNLDSLSHLAISALTHDDSVMAEPLFSVGTAAYGCRHMLGVPT